ncbi:uncharacterized protein LOC129599303 [Paramacrobiotus metropolitanus]|uniref:uncharacterized protein LOC129599303 n=1 Tax=Paramacrobiotus metropolitanus TaxID=2943436 RepID=UPI002445F83C|nr:uncharacterized protein LOC129599303 [Paramacrobiotus metropolitanus]
MTKSIFLLYRNVVGLCVIGFILVDAVMETDCNNRSMARTPPTENNFSQPVFPFRSDTLTLEECMAYYTSPDSYECNPRGLPYCNKTVAYPMSRTFLEVNCPRNMRASLAGIMKLASMVIPNRAITARLNERPDLTDPLHPDVLNPVRNQLIELTIDRCATPSVTFKFPPLGRLPYVVRLSVGHCKGMIIGRNDFRNVTQLRVFHLYESTIDVIEPYTFTDLVQLQNLALEAGLYSMMQFREKSLGPPEFQLSDEDIQRVQRLHCDCAFAWFRNFLQEKPYLIADRDRGEMFAIGSYLSDHITVHGNEINSMFRVDCARNLSTNNVNASELFSYNTHCFGTNC